jgi:Tfp pilus assembly protein PilN
MIQINLLPGSGKKTRSRGAGVDLAGGLSKIIARVKDPYLVAATVSAIVAALAVGGMYVTQRAATAGVQAALETAQQDSIRFSAVIAEKRKAQAERDSVLRQVHLIEAFDARRFVWPHIMEEVSRALPAYTWLTSISQTNTDAVLAAARPPAPPAKGKGKAKPKPASKDSVVNVPARFRIVGNTVDLQALTRFMRVLEASPFIENVQLVKSTLILVDGKEVTEFTLDAAYQLPDASEIRMTPVALAVR